MSMGDDYCVGVGRDVPGDLHHNLKRPVAADTQAMRRIGVMVLCLTATTFLPQRSLAAPADLHSPQAGKQCDGIDPAERGRRAPSETAQTFARGEETSSDSSTDGPLKLSLKAGGSQRETDAYGQFCTRDKVAQNAPDSAPPRPGGSVSHEQHQASPAAAAPEPASATPPAPSEPIAALVDGKLAVHATGQDLFTVLESVKAATGLAVDLPTGGGSDAVFMNMGPAPVKDVLLALFEGTPYNYILIGSQSDAQRVDRVILSARTSAQAPAQVAASSPEIQQPVLYGGQGVRADNDAEPIEPGPPEQPVQPSVIPSSVPTGIDIQQLAAKEGKTTGQILDELQKRQLEVLDQQFAAQQQSQPQ